MLANAVSDTTLVEVAFRSADECIASAVMCDSSLNYALAGYDVGDVVGCVAREVAQC